MGCSSKPSVLMFALIVLSSLVTIQPISVQADSTSNDWSSFLHDSAHTGASNGSGPTKPTVLWNYKESADSCVVSNGVVYAGGFYYDENRLANIIAFDAYNGAKIWNYSIYGLHTSPVVYGETLFIGINQTLNAFNALTRTEIWNYTLAAQVSAEPTITDGIAYVSSGSAYSYIGSDQYISSGLIKIGLSECNVYAINASTGTKIWNTTTENIPSAPAVSKINQQTLIFVSVGNKYVYALNASDGTKVWTHDTSSVITTDPVVGNNEVFICKIDESISALDAKTGTEKWSFNGPGGVQKSTPAFLSGVVYVGGHNGSIYALNASTGDKIWEYKTGTDNLWGSTVAGDIVYTGSDDGVLIALNATTGNKIWVFNADGVISSSVVANGILYFSGNDGFYAIGEIMPVFFLTMPVIVTIIAVTVISSASVFFLWKRHRKSGK